MPARPYRPGNAQRRLNGCTITAPSASSPLVGTKVALILLLDIPQAAQMDIVRLASER